MSQCNLTGERSQGHIHESVFVEGKGTWLSRGSSGSSQQLVLCFKKAS